jgi:LPS sulfotransferase NodH
VCATQRSGSTLLCELLKATGVAGRPEEFFEAEHDTGLPPHPGEYLEGLARTGAGVRDDPTPAEGPEYSSLEGVEDSALPFPPPRRACSIAGSA